jgi:hypothetical protein
MFMSLYFYTHSPYITCAAIHQRRGGSGANHGVGRPLLSLLSNAGHTTLVTEQAHARKIDERVREFSCTVQFVDQVGLHELTW